MFSFGKAKSVVNIVIEDYVIRMVENNGKDFISIKLLAEKVLPINIIKNGKIIDEMLFFNFMKEVVDEWGIKGKSVRFYVPHALVIMRELQIPDPVIPSEIKQYITMEIGDSIHFPFDNPIFDVYHVSGEENVEQVTVFAAPEEEIIKYTNVFHDVKLKPIAVDVQALGTYRYFYDQPAQIQPNDVYLFLEINLTSANLSIFSNHYMEFLRFQSLNVSPADWQPSHDELVDWTFTGDGAYLEGLIIDQINEIERIMNFYQYSIHQGQKAVTHIVLLGDLPHINDIRSGLYEQYTLPVITLSAGPLPIKETVSPAFIPALGLALRGGQSDA